MGRMEKGSLCPRCRKGKVYRIRRKDWMRRLPKSKHFRCEDCRAHFLTIYGWTIRLQKNPTDEDTPNSR